MEMKHSHTLYNLQEIHNGFFIVTFLGRWGVGVHREVVEKDYDKIKDISTISSTQKDNLKDSRKKEKKTLFPIYQALDDDDFEKILNAASAKEA